MSLQVPVSQRRADNAVKREVAESKAAGGVAQRQAAAAEMCQWERTLTASDSCPSLGGAHTMIGTLFIAGFVDNLYQKVVAVCPGSLHTLNSLQPLQTDFVPFFWSLFCNCKLVTRSKFV